MKKSDLRDGMVVQLRDGMRMMLINGIFINDIWMIIPEEYNEDLFSTTNGKRTKNDKPFDIMKVYTVNSFFTFNNLDSGKHLIPIFERKEISNEVIELLTIIKKLYPSYMYLVRNNASVYISEEKPKFNEHRALWQAVDGSFLSLSMFIELFDTLSPHTIYSIDELLSTS